MNSANDACPCGSTKTFTQCCGRFLDQGLSAKTPAQLMRSRYTAYAMGGYGEYLLSTWHNAQMPTLTAQLLSESSQQWYRLEIVHESQIGNQAMVEFRAYYLNKNSEPCMLHERSDFVRESGVWFYLSGEII